MATRAVCKSVAGVIGGLLALSAVTGGGAAYADPAQDAAPAQDTSASIDELSRKAEQLSETILNAQPDLDKKLQLLRQADEKHTADLVGAEASKTQLVSYQQSVDKFAAASYMGGRADGSDAILTAASPSNLIDKLAIQRMVGAEMSAQLQGFRRANQEAQIIEAASAQSAAEAKAAVDEAAAVRADLYSMRAQLRTQMAALNASYATLPPVQQAAVILPTAAVTAALGPIAPIPTVGTRRPRKGTCATTPGVMKFSVLPSFGPP